MFRNSVLAMMTAADRAAIEPELEPVKLVSGAVLVDVETPVEHLHFLEEGLASTVIGAPDGNLTETLMTGFDGVAGHCLVLGVDRAPAKTFMRTAGRAFRISACALRAAAAERAGVRDAILAYAHVAQIQTAYTALSNAAHRVEQRLARWLLMAHDRLDTDVVPLTHAAFSIMLNVRRASVTDALHLVEGKQLIRAMRGRVVVRDRSRLEAFAADAYGVPEAEAWRVLGFARAQSSISRASADTSAGIGTGFPMRGTSA